MTAMQQSEFELLPMPPSLPDEGEVFDLDVQFKPTKRAFFLKAGEPEKVSSSPVVPSTAIVSLGEESAEVSSELIAGKWMEVMKTQVVSNHQMHIPADSEDVSNAPEQVSNDVELVQQTASSEAAEAFNDDEERAAAFGSESPSAEMWTNPAAFGSESPSADAVDAVIEDSGGGGGSKLTRKATGFVHMGEVPPSSDDEEESAADVELSELAEIQDKSSGQVDENGCEQQIEQKQCAQAEVTFSPKEFEALAPPVPVHISGLFGVGIDFAQRLSILWAADLGWPSTLHAAMRWLTWPLAFDLGILALSLSSGVYLVAALLLPSTILLCVYISNKMYRHEIGEGSEDAKQSIFFGERWHAMRRYWLVFAICVFGILCGVALGVQEFSAPFWVLSAYWLAFNLAALLVFSFSRDQATKARQAAMEHGVDEKFALAFADGFVNDGVCTALGVVFVASWLPPVRACLLIFYESSEDGRQALMWGAAMAASILGLIVSLGVIIAAWFSDTRSSKRLYSASHISAFTCSLCCFFPISMTGLVFVVLSLTMFDVGGSDSDVAAGVTLPWSLLIPLTSIILYAGERFRDHPFGVIVAGDELFRFDIHRIIEFILRLAFAATAFCSAMLSDGRKVEAETLFPCLLVVFVNMFYVLVCHPHVTELVHFSDVASLLVLILILLVPLLPFGDSLDIVLACVILLFMLVWTFIIGPLNICRSLLDAPARMRINTRKAVVEKAAAEKAAAEEAAEKQAKIEQARKESIEMSEKAAQEILAKGKIFNADVILAKGKMPTLADESEGKIVHSQEDEPEKDEPENQPDMSPRLSSQRNSQRTLFSQAVALAAASAPEEDVEAATEEKPELSFRQKRKAEKAELEKEKAQNAAQNEAQEAAIKVVSF